MFRNVFGIALATVFLINCGGGGSSSGSDTSAAASTETEQESNSESNSEPTSNEVEGLDMPSNMSIVSAQEETESSGSSKTSFRGLFKSNLENTDYDQDEVRTYVYDSSMESLGTVNMILCLMEQTAASELVNEGAYIALVNEDKCEQGQNQDSSGETGQSSGGTVNEYNSWVVESTRASDSSPQIVKIWVPGEESEDSEVDPMDAQTILVEVTVNEGVSSTDPFGSFTMNFRGVVDGTAFGAPGSEFETMRGTLQTVDNQSDQPQYRFINVGGTAAGFTEADFGFTEAVNVVMEDGDGTAGQALTAREQSYDDGSGVVTEASNFAVSFNANHMLRGKDTNDDDTVDEQQCLARDAFDTSVWRYNLYHESDGTFNGQTVTAGQRVDINSGFPFQYDSDNDDIDDRHGWMGYHGVWADGELLEDGTVVTRFDYDNDSTESITLRVSLGKMIYRSANEESLSSFVGDEFQYWGQHPVYSERWGEWMVTVIEGNSFALTGTVDWTEEGRNVSTTFDHDSDPSTDPVEVSANLSFSEGESLWLWADSLGGNIVYVHDSSVAANERAVTFYAEEFIDPGHDLFANGAMTLYCYERCLMGGLTQDDVDAAESDHDLYHPYESEPLMYQLSTGGGKVSLLDLSNEQLVSAAGLDLSAIGYDWGINTGEMITTPLDNPEEPWRVYDAANSFRFETGNNDWNRLVVATDSNGDAIRFDRPLQFVYTHSTENDANGSSEYDGKTFMLDYNGPGNLHGFPWVEDEENHRWYAGVTLVDDLTLEANGMSFLVKGMEKEQTMQSVDVSECSALEVEELLTDPTFALPTLSDISDVSFELSDRPDITDAPRVIEGELQD